MNIEEIKLAVAQLSTTELTELEAWLARYIAQLWDQQIEADLEAGRLDALLAEVDEEYKRISQYN